MLIKIDGDCFTTQLYEFLTYLDIKKRAVIIYCRTFIGSMPVLMVYDGEWANEAFIKNFNVFTNRNTTKFGGTIDAGLLSVKDDHWRHARKTLSPVFTSIKLKNVSFP